MDSRTWNKCAWSTSAHADRSWASSESVTSIADISTHSNVIDTTVRKQKTAHDFRQKDTRIREYGEYDSSGSFSHLWWHTWLLYLSTLVRPHVDCSTKFSCSTRPTKSASYFRTSLNTKNIMVMRRWCLLSCRVHKRLALFVCLREIDRFSRQILQLRVPRLRMHQRQVSLLLEIFHWSDDNNQTRYDVMVWCVVHVTRSQYLHANCDSFINSQWIIESRPSLLRDRFWVTQLLPALLSC